LLSDDEESTLKIYQTAFMCDAIPKTRFQVVASLVAVGLSASFVPLMSEPDHPTWWVDRGVTNANTIENKGVANLGQLKHIAVQAHSELEDLFLDGANYPQSFPVPPSRSPSWYEDQKKALNLGQLKAVAKPIYDRANSIDPNWVLGQLSDNGLLNLGVDHFLDSNGYIYPWNPSTPVSENYKVATVGQLKLVFALDFRESDDGDAAPDLLELDVFGDTNEVITAVHDTNGDGFVNYNELRDGYGLPGIDSDMDGLLDVNETASGSNQNWKDHPAVKLGVVVGN